MAKRDSAFENRSSTAAASFVGALVAAIGDPRSAIASTQESIGALLVRQELPGPCLMGPEFSRSPKVSS
jgi:hypothetical protein